MRSRDYDEPSDGFDYRGKRLPCRRSCARNPFARNHFGELCEDCEAREAREERKAIEDDDRERCPVCEVPKEEHDDAYPCNIESQD